ncbi:type I-E CRISPR-associated protein Cse2/CasB [Micropruina sp.]|uniref:type I-E CRISPR-associated protein Cse2/CasB n=1 Tax=Micropruina sp. TaxID=2737536 RepID=UPI0039E6C50B
MTDPKPAVTRAEVLSEDVGRRVRRLQRSYLDPSDGENSESTATLARLRRCAPDAVGADPMVWAVTLADLPDQLRSRNKDDEASPAERAVHAALVLYATHQQSNQIPVHVTGASLGGAVRRLAEARAHNGEPDESSIRRLHQVVLANDAPGRLHHLRGLITLLRSESDPIPLDYAQLAVDLWRLLDPKQDSAHVVARWGRELHNRPRATTGESE